MSAPNGNSAFVPAWMAELGIKADGPNGWLNMSKAQLRSQQRPDKPLKVQVWATGMLHSPGYNGQEATTMRGGKKVPLRPGDFISELFAAAKQYYESAGIKATEKEWHALRETKEHIRRALMDLEEDGVALRTDMKGTPLRELSLRESQRLPSGRTRIFFWLIPRAADPENVASEWRDRQEILPETDPSPLLEDNREVAKSWLPTPSILQILKVFQIEVPNKAQMADPNYQKIVEEARGAARKVFLEVVNSWLPQRTDEVATNSPPEVATTGGALESKAERKEVVSPVPPPSSPTPPLNEEFPTTTTSVPTAADVVVVAERLAIKKPAAQKFLTVCRTASPGCTVAEIVAVIDQVDSTINRKTVRNPTAVLLENVPLKMAARGMVKAAGAGGEPEESLMEMTLRLRGISNG